MLEIEPPYVLSLLWYTNALVLAYLFAWRYESSTYRRSRQIYLLLSFLSVWGFCALRFYVGNDYAAYVNFYDLVQPGEFNAFNEIEPFFALLYHLSAGLPCSFLWMFGLTSLLTYILIFSYLVKHRIVKYGVVLLFLTRYLLFSNDIIRQALAIALLLHAIDALRERKWIRYIIVSSIMLTMHRSSLIITLFLPILKHVLFTPRSWILILCLSYVTGLTGVLIPIFNSLLDSIPLYGERYIAAVDLYTFKPTIGLHSLLMLFLGVFTALHLRKIGGPSVMAHLFLLGTTLSFLFQGLFLFQRIADYFVLLGFVPLANIMYSGGMNRLKRLALLSPLLLYFALQILYAKEKHGGVPYQTWLKYSVEEIESSQRWFPVN